MTSPTSTAPTVLGVMYEDDVDWRELWELRGPDPEPLKRAAADMVALARSGQWQPSPVDRAAARRVRHVLQWTPDKPLGPTVGAAAQVFAEVLREELSDPVRRVLREAARVEPLVPRPGSWGESMTAVCTGDLDH